MAEISEKVTGGVPLIKVEEQLNGRGIPSPEGSTWRRGVIRKMAMSPACIGKRVLRGEVVGDGQWDGLVDEETYWAAVRLLKDPSRKTTRAGRGRPPAVLRRAVRELRPDVEATSEATRDIIRTVTDIRLAPAGKGSRKPFGRHRLEWTYKFGAQRDALSGEAAAETRQPAGSGMPLGVGGRSGERRWPSL